MADYELYYWPLPFRGQFIRAILAYAGKSWNEHDADAIDRLRQSAPDAQPIPFMGPPLLIDNDTGFALAQMPAIAFHLGRTLGLLPDDDAGQAMTLKLVNDANDILDEITLDGGREMWTRESWDAFVPRLKRWMRFFEVVGARNGLAHDRGFLLGGEAPGVADIVTATLWSTLRDRFSVIGAMLDEEAPLTAALCRRMMTIPALTELAQATARRYGDAYCGGEIEKSLRTVVER